MESGKCGASSSEGVLIPVSESSDDFQSCVLAPLKSAYLYDDSKQFFRYKSAVLVKNPELEEKYNAFRTKRKNAGYSEEDLKESYGFLLFDDDNKAKELGETGVLTGNSTCTTLGDPSKGAYISMYSDCLDLNRWYHGKSGFIAIIRLTKGKVKNVVDNYTQNLTEPTMGFDCHVSQQLSSVSGKTSSFLAFERTQYYIYELLGNNESARSPSAACPFAIVSFSYMDTKENLPVPWEKGVPKKTHCNYLLWRGQLQIGSLFYNVDLRSLAGAFCPAKLPPVVKITQVISMSDLQKLLPRAAFETSYTDEVFLDGFHSSLCEFVPTEAEDTSSFAQLLRDINEKDLALTIPLNDGGCLILLHPSNFLRYDDTESTAAEVLQGIFVFPESRVVRRDISFGKEHPAVAPEILQFVPVLNYAEGEVEKASVDPSEELCEVLMPHMHTYATLINPGLAESPSREVNIFPDQYDVAESHEHIYSSPEWTKRALQSIKSYLSKPACFQLPVSKVSEILAAGQEEQREELVDDVDDVYIHLSSPEGAPASPFDIELEDRLSDQETRVNAETSVDLGNPGTESIVDQTVVPHDAVPHDAVPHDAVPHDAVPHDAVPHDAVPHDAEPENLHAGDVCKESEEGNHLTKFNKTDDTDGGLPTLSTSQDLPAELIVKITSAEESVTEERLRVVGNTSTLECNDFDFSVFSPKAKLQTAAENTFNSETDKIQRVVNSSDATNQAGIKRKKRRRRRSNMHKRYSKPLKKFPKACEETLQTCTTLESTPSFQTVTTPVEVDSLHCDKDELDLPQLSKPPKIKMRKIPRRKRRFGKLSKKKKVTSAASVVLEEEERKETEHQNVECKKLKELEAYPLRRKMERWDIKPVISECGRILVPHGAVDFDEQVKSLKDNYQPSKDECLEKMQVDAPVNVLNTVEMEQKTSGASEMGVDEMEAIHAKDVGNHHPQCVAEVDFESISKQSDDGGGSVPLTLESSAVSPRSSSTDPSLPQEVQEKKAEKLPERCLPKSKFLLSRLKSVLSRRKGKRDFPVTVEKAENIPQDSVPFFKQAKVDSDTEGLDLKNTTTKGANLHDKEVSKTVDPDFAYALGLTPKEFLGKVQSAEEQSTRFQPLRVLQRAPLIFPRSRRIKTLKKHQGISAENVKKNWWLHFQTPGCITSETFKNTDCTSDISNRKTVKRKVKSSCSSAEALNLLADLALGVRNDQGPPQPNPAFERKPEESLKNCDFTKGLTDAQQESVLHALLRTPPARPIQTVESPAPTPLVGDSKLVSEEHTYSLPPSSSPPLGLSGSPFQVTPLSGSTGVLHHHHHHHHHHQTKDDDGVQRTDPSFIEEDISEDKRSSEHPHRHRHRRRLRRCRTFALKDGSIQVTRQWRENYDFRRDSRFSCHPKDKVVVRALHGPWDFSIQDTNEEVRLIFHMWIGLFYSRSTDRFFHMDSCLKYPYSEVDALKMAEGMVSGATGPEVEGGSTACPLSSVDASDPLVSEPQDLSKKDGAVTESVVLDLSLRNSKARPDPSELQAHRNLTRVPTAQMESFKAFSGPKLTAHLQDASKLQCEKKDASCMEIIKALNDVGRRPKSKNDASTQKDVCLEHGNGSSFQGDGTIIPQQEEDGSGPIKQETVPRPLGFSKAPNECNKDGIHPDISVNSETTKCLAQKDGKDSSISVTDTEKDDKKEGVTVHTDELELKTIQMRNDPCQEGNVNPSLEKIHPCDGSANKELGNLLSKNGLGKEKLSREECKVVSPDQMYPLNGNADCSTGCTEFRGNDHKREDGLKDHPLPNTSDGPLKEDLSPTQTEEQPPLADSTKVTWSDLCGNPFLNISSTPSEIMLTFDNSAAEKSFRKDICLGDKAGYQKATLPMSDGSSCSSKEPCTELHSPHTKGSVQARDENEVSDFSFDLGSIGHNDQDSKLTHTDLRSPKEPFQNQPHPTEGENNMPRATKTTLKPCKMSDKVDKQREIVIPFIGIDTSGVIIVQSQGKIEEAVGNQEAIPFISETTNSEVVQPSEDSTLTPVRDETAECSPKISPLDVNESQKPVVLDSVFGDSWPTPAVSEKMDDNLCSSPSRSTSVFINKFHSRSSTPVTEEPSFTHKVQTSTFKAEPNLHQGLTSDLELRTLRVVQKLNEFLSTSKHMDNQKEAADKRSYPHQRPNLSTKPVSTCSVRDRISVGYKTRKASKRRTPMRSISSSQGPRTKSPEDVQPQHFSDKMEEILGVKLQLKNSASSVPQHRSRSANEQPISTGPDCYSYIPFISAESVQDVRKTPSQSSLNHGARSYSQRPVMAVKPSKSEESQGHCFWRDPNGSNGLIGSYTGQSSISLETQTKERSDGLSDENCDVHEFSSLITSRLSNDGYSNSTSDAEPFALQNPPHQSLGKNISKFVMVPSLPLFVEPYDSAESYPRALDDNHILLTHNLIPKEEDINQNDYSDKFLEYHEEEGIREDGRAQQPETTLVCTVTNTGWREPSLLEQLSRRCIQDDPTQGSIEQECLIFSEQMKNLLKKKKELVCQQDIHGSVRLPCTSPVTVNFSSLEEQDDSPDFFDESIVGQKIEIDLSDRKNLRDSTEGDRSLHSQRPGNPMEHPGISDMTAECARLYQAKMDDICSVKKVPSRQRGSGMYQGHPRSGPSKHFDFCGQMKKELDETFRSNLNAVVKKSCRTKYRFYLLVTADDVFFEETKALLEAEGHIAVQPSEFFLAEDCSSSLFIILRNEDIAEHISEVPDLLKLKMSPGVQFAGIDEPDDIVNLTHQELFTHGGFIMVNRVVLETLSLCNMKAISEILLELGRSGKWKWILHYKDSRRWKENARLSKEDNEKKQFLFWGKDTGMLEVLPYHDCDLVTKDEPDYLACLLQLQVQNVSSRYIIFITDTRDSALEENGILTLTLTNFLAKFSGQSD